LNGRTQRHTFPSRQAATKREPLSVVAGVAPLFDKLFLEPYGVVDINGASEGETTQASSPRGSTFLRPLCDCFRENRNRRLSWGAIVEELDPKIKAEIWLRCPHAKDKTVHTTRIWSLPHYDLGPRLGIKAVANSGDGVRLVEVWRDYPASRAVATSTGRIKALLPGNVILSINGRSIQDLDRLFNAVMGSSEEMALTVRDGRTGTIKSMTTTLRY